MQVKDPVSEKQGAQHLRNGIQRSGLHMHVWAPAYTCVHTWTRTTQKDIISSLDHILRYYVFELQYTFKLFLNFIYVFILQHFISPSSPPRTP